MAAARGTRYWGVVISLFYALLVFGLLLPVFAFLSGERDVTAFYRERAWVFWAAALVAGQALLLFVSVDASWRIKRPRQRVAVTAAVTGGAAALLTGAILVSALAGLIGDSVPEAFMTLWLPLSAWAVWGVVFYAYYRSDPDGRLATVVTWLIRGSVLDLLIAVPAHVVVRRREMCSAPGLTAFGIVTGIAVMVLCFGPGVLALYRKRIESYEGRPAPAAR